VLRFLPTRLSALRLQYVDRPLAFTGWWETWRPLGEQPTLAEVTIPPLQLNLDTRHPANRLISPDVSEGLLRSFVLNRWISESCTLVALENALQNGFWRLDEGFFRGSVSRHLEASCRPRHNAVWLSRRGSGIPGSC
jgi:hypothetical protein